MPKGVWGDQAKARRAAWEAAREAAREASIEEGIRQALAARDHVPDTGSLIYTVAEAAALLGLSSWSYYDGVKAGRLPAIRLSPRRLVVPKVAIERLLSPQ